MHGRPFDAGQDTLTQEDSVEGTEAGPSLVDLSFRVRPAPRLDLLFVVDNSPSMAAKQPKLAAQFAKIISGLSNGCNGDKIDLRLAVITTDMGRGCIPASGSCGSSANGSLKGDQGRFQFTNASAWSNSCLSRLTEKPPRRPTDSSRKVSV